MKIIKYSFITLLLCTFLLAIGEPPRISENRTELTKQFVSVLFIKNNTTIRQTKGFFIGDSGYILMPRDLLLKSDKVMVIVNGDTKEYHVTDIYFEDKAGDLVFASVGYIPPEIHKKMEVNIENNNLSDELYVISDFNKILLKPVTINFFNTVSGFGSIFSHSYSGKEKYMLTPLLNKYGQVVGINYNYTIDSNSISFSVHSQRLLAMSKVEEPNFYAWQAKNKYSGQTAPALYYLGALCLYSKDPQAADTALTYLKQAVSLAPDEPVFHHQLAYVLLFHKNEPKEAKDHFTKCIELAPDYYGGYLGLALCDIYNENDKNRITAALQHLDKALEKDPQNFYVWYTKASVFVDCKEYEKAKEAYKKAIEIYPGYSIAHNDLGLLYYSLGQKDDAKYEFEQAINSDQAYANPHYNLGVYYQDKREFESALAEFKLSSELNSSDVYALHKTGVCYAELSKYPEAEKYLKTAISLNPKYPNPYYSLAYIYSKKRNYPGMIRMLNNYIELDKTNSDAYYWLGCAYYNLKEYKSSVAFLKKAIELNNQDYGTYNQLGIVLEEINSYDEAIKYLDKAVAIDPSCSYAYFNLSKCYTKLKNKEKALYNYRKFQKIKPYDTQELDQLLKEYLAIPFNASRE